MALRHAGDVRQRRHLVTDLDGTTGLVRYVIAATGDAEHTFGAVLRDADGVEVAAAEGPSGELAVPDVHRWAPGDGYLYTLEAQLLDGSGALLDSYLQTVGVRTVEVRGAQFLINGEPLYFTGFGKHEDAPVRGKGHDDAFLVHDFALMKWIGANSFRTSHYPYADEVYDYADRQGVVIVDEVAAVGQNMGLSGGIIGGEKHVTFSPETIDDAARAKHAQASWSHGTRTTRAWSCGRSPTSRSPTRAPHGRTSSRCSP